MESSIAVFLKRWLACELPPTEAAHGSARTPVHPPCTAHPACAATAPTHTHPSHPAAEPTDSGARYQHVVAANAGKVAGLLPLCGKLAWLVLGGDPAARSHRVEQFTAL